MELSTMVVIFIIILACIGGGYMSYLFGLAGLILVGVILFEICDNIPQFHISHRKSRNISKLVQDILSAFNLTPDNYEWIKVGNEVLKNSKKLKIEVKKRNSSVQTFPLDKYGYSDEFVSNDSVKVIINRLLKELPNGRKYSANEYITKHFHGGASITGIDSQGNFTYTSSEGGDLKVDTFIGFEIVAADIAQTREKRRQEQILKNKQNLERKLNKKRL
mgnify:CR=1 FL=1